MKKRKSMVAFVLAFSLLGGCGMDGSGEAGPEDIRQSVTGSGPETEEDKNAQASGEEDSPWKLKPPFSGNEADGYVAEAMSGGGSPQDARLKGRQITDQSFQVRLDGWGEVTFASYEPEYLTEVDEDGAVRFGDARFALLKGGQSLYVLPGENEENAWHGLQFSQVLSVSFRDYNQDGRTDILLLLEYVSVQGPDVDVPRRMARLYTQEEGEREFHMDVPVSEYLKPYTENMVQMTEGLEKYAFVYNIATEKSAWEVERFARMVKRHILEGDFEALSESIAFPIMVGGVAYRDREEFLEADFIRHPNPEFLEALQMEECGNLFANSQGIMLGNGLVWIGETADGQELRVIALNGLD